MIDPLVFIGIMLSVSIATLTTNAVVFMLMALYIKSFMKQNTDNYRAAVQKYVESVANYQAAMRAQEEKKANKYTGGGFN